MSVFAYSQNGLTIQKTKSEYPKRIFYKGTWVTMFTDSLFLKMDNFRIDYKECFALKDSLKTRLTEANSLITTQRVEIVGLKKEVQTSSLLIVKQDDEIQLQDLKITGLETENKRLRRKTGFLGGVIVVLGVVTAVIAIN